MTTCTHHTIEQTADGSATLYVPQLDEHYHSTKGARTESQHIFIDMGLSACTAPAPRILEIGFGTGLNAWLTLEAATQQQRPVCYVGIERYPLSWNEVEALHYTDHPLFRALHDAPWNQATDITPNFTLHKMQADATLTDELAARLCALPPFDVIYFDAFAPDKQEEMWSEALFHLLYSVLNTGGILTTYCAKGVIRRRLQSVGFHIERLPGPPGGKREMLRATKISQTL